jgi:hypothetical protein
MKPFFMKTSLILCTLFLWAGMSMADVIHIGTFTGNDNPEQYDVSSLVIDYNTANSTQLPQPLTLLGKWNVNKNLWEEVDLAFWGENEDPGFEGSFFSGGISGIWSAPDDWVATDPLYYSLKAATQFALYYANGATSGDWEIDWTVGKNPNKPNYPDLSHISFWTADGSNAPPNPVPEPGTLALVGLGLATLAGYRRKRHSS